MLDSSSKGCKKNVPRWCHRCTSAGDDMAVHCAIKLDNYRCSDSMEIWVHFNTFFPKSLAVMTFFGRVHQPFFACVWLRCLLGHCLTVWMWLLLLSIGLLPGWHRLSGRRLLLASLFIVLLEHITGKKIVDKSVISGNASAARCTGRLSIDAYAWTTAIGTTFRGKDLRLGAVVVAAGLHQFVQAIAELRRQLEVDERREDGAADAQTAGDHVEEDGTIVGHLIAGQQVDADQRDPQRQPAENVEHDHRED